MTLIIIVIFIGFWNSSSNSWTRSRLELARISQKAELWKNNVTTIPEGITQDDFNKAQEWMKRKKYTEDELIRCINQYEKNLNDHVRVLQMPILGLAFDINDLGILGGIWLALILLWLIYCIIRQHENLRLCVWKIRKLAENEEIGPGSKANFLYHALAMTQVLTCPPTLAEGSKANDLIRKFFRIITKIIFTVPLITHLMLFIFDMRTFEVAKILNETAAVNGRMIQIITLSFNFILISLCIYKSRNMDKTWNRVFNEIKPKPKKD
jgi:hypothetical protein